MKNVSLFDIVGCAAMILFGVDHAMKFWVAGDYGSSLLMTVMGAYAVYGFYLADKRP